MPARISNALAASLTSKTAKRSKYGNVKVHFGDMVFDSRREFNRFMILRTMDAAGLISDLKRQVRFPLKVGDKLVCTYVADFTYSENGALVVEDAKGHRTREYINKAKLFEAIHGFPIREV